MASTLERLKNKIFSKGTDESKLTSLMDLSREYGILGDILGRDYEVKDPQGKLIATIRQKPIYLKQLNTLMNEADILRKKDNENSGGKTKPPLFG